MNRISDLEAAVLYVLRRTGGCTSYRIRQTLADSPTPRFSGSTGAIYPLVRRLETNGLVKSTSHKTGKRAHRLCKATPAGLRALRQWIKKPDPLDFQNPYDPILTRVNMLASLSHEEALNFLNTAIRGLESSLVTMKPAIRELSELEPPFSTRAGRCVKEILRARIKWLRTLAAELE